MSMLTEKEKVPSALADERYISITTFRRDGSSVSTPVWVVSDDRRRLLIATSPETWKARRIRANPRVRVAGCNARGKVHGETIDGIARFVDEEALVRRLQIEKYGWQKRLSAWSYELVRRIRQRPREEAVFIEVVIAPADAAAVRA